MAIFKRRSQEPKPSEPPEPPEPFAETAPLNEAEQSWLQSLLAELNEAGVDTTDEISLGRYYDDSFAEWIGRPEAERTDPNPIINRIGAGLGSLLAARTGLEWVVATDTYGTELALFGQPGNVLIYPPNIVGKRWAASETAFLPALVQSTVDRVTAIRNQAPHA